jgi:hypothetical protein
MQWSLALLAGIGTFTLLLPLFLAYESFSRTVEPWVVVLAPCSMLILLLILYGHGTACPRCRKWWARTKVESEFVDREVFDKGGVSFAKSLYRTTYQCAACRHRWSAMQADEYREPARQCQKPYRR